MTSRPLMTCQLDVILFVCMPCACLLFVYPVCWVASKMERLAMTKWWKWHYSYVVSELAWSFSFYRATRRAYAQSGLCRGKMSLRPSHAGIPSKRLYISPQFLSASLYVSKRGAYWDRLCRDVVGRWLVGWSLVVTRVHCGQTVHPRPIVTMEH